MNSQKLYLLENEINMETMGVNISKTVAENCSAKLFLKIATKHCVFIPYFHGRGRAEQVLQTIKGRKRKATLFLPLRVLTPVNFC